jgi:hypothetical protein
MSDGPSRGKRVVVTGPVRGAERRRSRQAARDIDEQTAVGEAYMRSLLRTQLRLALSALATVLVPLGLLPLIFTVHPPTAELRVGPLPLAWLLLGVLVYPLLVLVGWRYVRQVEHNERAFERMVSRR